jgi:hypothetical protein
MKERRNGAADYIFMQISVIKSFSLERQLIDLNFQVQTSKDCLNCLPLLLLPFKPSFLEYPEIRFFLLV